MWPTPSAMASFLPPAHWPSTHLPQPGWQGEPCAGLGLLRRYTLLSCLSTLYSVCASQWVGLISAVTWQGKHNVVRPGHRFPCFNRENSLQGGKSSSPREPSFRSPWGRWAGSLETSTTPSDSPRLIPTAGSPVNGKDQCGTLICQAGS